MRLTQSISRNAKNVLGARTTRRIVAFAVDDYGNVRAGTKQAQAILDREGLRCQSRYDKHDTLESVDDFNALFEVLRQYRDVRGRHPVITALTLTSNIDFEAMLESQFDRYRFEHLPTTYGKCGANYQGMMQLWQQGINDSLICPEFHGREHYHVATLLRKLGSGSRDAVLNINNRCYSRIIQEAGKPKWTATYGFEKADELSGHKLDIVDGLQHFSRIFGRRAQVFNTPSGHDHHTLFVDLGAQGIDYIEKSSFVQREHQGDQRYAYRVNYTGKREKNAPPIILRNCVFEPTDPTQSDWLGYTMRQIDAAFFWRKPAIISSHRVNFSGTIDEGNRKLGLASLNQLLSRILAHWPDTEFMSIAELGKTLAISDRRSPL
jgi:hypothetical protein